MDAPAVIIPIVVVAVLVVLLALYLWVTRNSLVALRQRVDEAWSDITAQTRRRAELLPALVQTVQQYASHEPAVLQAVTDARTESLQAATPADASVAEAHMQQALRSLYSSAEAYPRLMASPNLLQLQADVADAENGIQASRRFYNGGVRELNTKIRVFPGSLFARRMGFQPREFFEGASGSAVAEPPRIQF